MPLPKVLIINQPFNSNTGGGVTLSNLFSNWCKDNLAVACTGYLMTNEIDPKLCNNYYQLGEEERKWIFPFSLFNRKYYSGKIKITPTSKDNLVTDKSKVRDKLIMNYLLPVLEYCGFSHFKAKTILSHRFCYWLEDFSPDVIYIQPASLEELDFYLAVKQHLKKPLVFHMMDDWPSTFGKKGFMAMYWKKRIDEKLQLLYENTELPLAISDYMAKEYKRRYGKEFTVFHNPINIDFWKSSQKKKYSLPQHPVLLYAGRIGLGIDQSLETIAEAIRQVNQDLRIKIRFTLQTSETPVWIKNYDFIEHRSLVSYNKLPEVFSEADFLILPYDFSEKSINFIKYSMPTKAPEYMASGTPIIVFGPNDTAMVEYAKNHQWAKVVTKNNHIVLAKAIKELLKSEGLRKELSQNAVYLAETKHDSKRVTHEFATLLQSVTNIPLDDEKIE